MAIMFNGTPNGGDNVVAALEHPGRVRQVKLTILALEMDGRLIAIQVSILSNDKNLPIVPVYSDLVKLELINIPLTGYMSPAALVACPAVLPGLGSLSIALTSNRRLHAPIQCICPPRGELSFSFSPPPLGVNAHTWRTPRFGTPRLGSVNIMYSNRLDFRVPQLSGFVNHSALRSQAISVRVCGNFR
ncbi:hypothetical protein EDB89DRAFT_2029719 [Lactarius sanguifluus]|nr:hypothetical protein EDB89DRAFT_2029719 [Lactarius sanguifluus]